MRRQVGFFDVDDRLKRLSDLGDQLEAFEAAVEFEAFRPEQFVRCSQVRAQLHAAALTQAGGQTSQPVSVRPGCEGRSICP